MIWIIAKKEFRNNIVTPGFMIGMLLCLTLIPYTVYTGIKTYEVRLEQYNLDIKAAEDVYQKAQVYATVNPIIVKPVSPMIIFSKGISEQTGSRVKLDRKEKPVFSSNIVSLSENPFMGNFISLDFTTALTILLSLLGILFSYDMLSREKEQGTLKLSLCNPVSRSAFFLGKVAGIFMTLVPILIVCFLVVFIIIQLSPSVKFAPEEYGRIMMLMILSLTYFSFFVFMGGLISSRTKNSTTGIIVNLFIWCSFLFLLPGVTTYTGKNLTKITDYKNLEYDLGQINLEFQSVIKEVENTLEKENLIKEGYRYTSGWDWDGQHLILFTPKATTIEYERRKKELLNPLIIENCDKKWIIQSDYLQQVYSQEKTIRYLSCLSPSEIFKHISASLCRTDMSTEVHFMDQVRQFQDVFYGYFIQNKIYSSYAYFAIQKEEDMPKDWDEANAMAAKWEAESQRESTFDFSSFGYMDTSHLPRFTYTQSTFGDSLAVNMFFIAGILIACILLFWFSYISFIKYDVR